MAPAVQRRRRIRWPHRARAGTGGRRPLRATAQIRKGRSENGVARDVGAALQAQAGKRYAVEIDDGEDVLVKKHDGERNFVITLVENSVQGVRIEPDAE
jgi:hypothetical protein